MEQKERGFLLYPDYADKIKKLPLEQAGALFLAIFDYVRDGTIPELEPAADMCFAFIVSQFERDKEKYDETCRKRAVAGRKGAEATNSKRRQAAAKAANAESDGEPEAAPEHPDATAEAGAVTPEPEEKPRRKKQEPKKVKYGEFVHMTEEEHRKLVEQYGEQQTARMIEILDNYKGSKGKTYKNDYRAILCWVAERVQEEFQRRGGNTYGGFGQNSGGGFKPSGGFGGGN